MQETNSTITISLSSTTNTQYVAGGGNTGVSSDLVQLACWYQPLGDTTAFRKTLQQYNFIEHHTDPGGTDWPDFHTWMQGFEDQATAHENDNPPGTWYQSECADWSSAYATAWGAANPDFVYVAPNTTPPANTPTVTPVELAKYALASAKLPPTTPSFSPDAANPSVVNLSTWAWEAAGKQLDLTASLAPLSATVLMTPTTMTLTTNGPTAGGIPNVCQDANGVIGVKPPTGAGDPSAPGCGLKFTAPGNYNVHADITWKITWTSPQVAGVQTLPDVHMTADTAITAHEIQTIN